MELLHPGGVTDFKPEDIVYDFQRAGVDAGVCVNQFVPMQENRVDIQLLTPSLLVADSGKQAGNILWIIVAIFFHCLQEVRSEMKGPYRLAVMVRTYVCSPWTISAARAS